MSIKDKLEALIQGYEKDYGRKPDLIFIRSDFVHKFVDAELINGNKVLGLEVITDGILPDEFKIYDDKTLHSAQEIYKNKSNYLVTVRVMKDAPHLAGPNAISCKAPISIYIDQKYVVAYSDYMNSLKDKF